MWSVCWSGLSENGVTCRRAIQVSGPRDSAWPLSCVDQRSPQRECRPISAHLHQVASYAASRRSRPATFKTARQTPIQQFDSAPGSFDLSATRCWGLDVQANAERLCESLRTERPVLSVGSPECKAFMDLNRRDPKFFKTLEAALSHVMSLMEINHWQSEQGRWFSA